MNMAIPSDAVIVQFLEWLLRTSLSAAGVAGLVLLAQFLFVRWLTPAWRYRLWGLVVLRLLLPVVPPSATSVWNAGRLIPAPWSMFGPGSQRSQATSMDGSTSGDEGLRHAKRLDMVVTYGAVPALTRAAAHPAASGVRTQDNRSWPASSVLLAVWIAVASLLFGRVLICNAILIRRLRGASPVRDARVLDELGRCCRAAGVLRRPMLCITDVVRVPAAAGLWRTRILLPSSLIDRLSNDELRAVLLHELAHIRCRDIAVNWMLAALHSMHWFNPVVWLAFTRLRADREAARDAMVLRWLAGTEPAAASQRYGRTLLNIAERLSPEREPAGLVAGVAGLFGPPALLLPGLFGRPSALQRRLQMITRYPDGARRRSWLGPALAILLAATALTCAKNPRVTYTPASSSPATRPVASAPPPVNALQQKLDKVLPEIQFTGTQLSDVIDFFRNVSGANIFVNWKSLEAAGVERDTPITATFRPMKLSKALSIILDSAGGGQRKLGYQVDNDVLVISSMDDLAKNVEVRVYDIRDLIVSIPNFDNAPQLGKPEIGTTTAPAPTQPANSNGASGRAQAVKDIVQTIESTVAPETWKDRGGTVAALRELNGQLIVTQTPENQAQVVHLLDQLRDAHGLQCTVEARFVSCDEPVARALLAKWQKIAAPATLHPAGVSTQPGGSGAVGFFLDDAQIGEFLKAGGNEPAASIIAAPRLTLFSGQRAWVMVARSRRYIGAYAATTVEGGQTRYDPVLAVVQSGVVLDVQATINADRTAATLVLHPQISALLGMKQVPWPGRPAGSNLMVQEPDLRTTELQTTVSVPAGRTLVLGGLEDPSAGHAAEGASIVPEPLPNRPLRSLFLLVKPTPIIGTAGSTKFPLLKSSRRRAPQP
jgi:beta-lactamase regulating signal transducer with metallopeptidase domain/type II secretory pathway component GspD/PulD (secretin)